MTRGLESATNPVNAIETNIRMSFPPVERHDSEPGLFSLTQMQHLMRVEFARSQRYGYALGCLTIVIDRLGSLRDLYGFDSKENIVQEVVAVMRRETRSSDYVGRTPDDKLLCIVPHTPAEGLARMGERILDSVRGLEFASDGRTYKITVSIGASSAEPGATLFFDALLEGSQEALDAALEAGGDRYIDHPVGG